MTKISPEALAALEEVTQAQENYEQTRAQWTATWEEYSSDARALRVQAVRAAYLLGAPKRQIGIALGTKDRRTVIELIDEGENN